MTKQPKLYSLRQSRHILHSCYGRYKKRAKHLPPEALADVESNLAILDQAVINGDAATADPVAHHLEAFEQQYFKKTYLEYAKELVFALIFALIIATVVRQMWFELYEIPTGSMRPTFKEEDHLTVSKLAFGINFPLKTEHLYFDPDLVQRTSIYIFSGDNLPLPDVDTTYFLVLPYKKRYIKRSIGKPGDSLYFYGGQIYGVDKDANPINELLNSPWMDHLEHIPFMSFRGEMSFPSNNQIMFKQMNLPAGRMVLSAAGALNGEVYNGKEWIKDQPDAQKTPHDTIKTYSDIYGMRNFAMARLLTKQQLKELPYLDGKGLDDAPLYAELQHTPSMTYPKPFFQRTAHGINVALVPNTAVIPMKMQHLDTLMDNMYTARFVVKDQRGARYDAANGPHYDSRSPLFPGVPDGTYEFYFGKAYKIDWGGIAFELAKDHPLYNRSPENIQRLYNLGIELNTAFAPQAGNQTLFPHRYAYFRDHNLYMLGSPVFKSDDPILKAFNENESEKEKHGSANRPYIAFKDYGPPLKEDGSYDTDFIRTFGVTLPEKQYLALGDNHAMSADSRIFGFVPEANLQGAPSLIIWPPGNRLGFPAQKPYPIINTPRLIVWGIAALILIIWGLIHYRHMHRPVFKKIKG